MSCVHDIIVISGLAVTVYTAYKNAPLDDDRHILKDIAALQILIDKAAQHLKGTTISSNGRLDGQRVLRGCQSVLQDLYFLIEKYNRLVLINKRLVLKGVRLGKEDITTLQIRLISETVLLKGVVQSYEYIEVQAQLTAILGPHGANSRASVTSIASFAANTNTNTSADTAYRWFYKDLNKVGVTEDVKRQKGGKILEIFRSQGIIASGVFESGGSKIRDKDLVLEAAYKQFCNDLCQMGVTEALQPPRDEILKILRSRGIVSSSQTGGGRNMGGSSNTENNDHDSSTKVIPSFRLNSRVNWFPTGHKSVSLMPEALNNTSLLHLAADKSHIGTVKLLFGKDALLDQGSNTFLHCAAAHGYTDTVKLLLNKGALIEAVNTDHYSPLHLAAKFGHTGAVELLLEEGASLEAMGKNSCTPLHIAAQKGHTPTVELLLKRGASIGALDKYNETPLHLAAGQGHIDIEELLLGKGAPVNGPGKLNLTPLHWAARYGHTGVVELLLGKGASIGAMDNRKWTPLHLAAYYGHTDVVELLLGKGASFEAKNKERRTPLYLATQQGHTDTVQLLQNKAAELGVHGSRTLLKTIFGGKKRS